ncbi:hypothetical protein LTS10_010664 [Elasticomyces elasticus]|nr:hypothetical protein LTS10_010664 [Elasticomyces elasticus]
MFLTLKLGSLLAVSAFATGITASDDLERRGTARFRTFSDSACTTLDITLGSAGCNLANVQTFVAIVVDDVFGITAINACQRGFSCLTAQIALLTLGRVGECIDLSANGNQFDKVEVCSN